LHRRLNDVSKPRSATEKGPTATRVQAAADALGSVRAEGLDPGRAEPLLTAWARGELSDAQLEEARLRLLAVCGAPKRPAQNPWKGHG
jgi:hypothetical protein